MTHLLIGGGGFVGMGMRVQLAVRDIEAFATSRPGFDLRAPDFKSLPSASATHVYLVAAMTKFAECEGSALAWMVNADAPIAIARHFQEPIEQFRPAGVGLAQRFYEKPFIVFISSDAVENMGHTAYGRQKAHVESYMQSIDAAIVRPSKIQPWHLPEFCNMVIDVALEKKAGVTRWP